MKLNEESEEFKAIRESWEERAKVCESLDEFVGELLSHDHDYGTIVWAIAAAMKAAYYRINRSPEGGITGFQASCLAWEMLDHFGLKDPVGMRLIGYSELCFPQHEDHFTSIPWQMWENAKNFAQAQVEEHGSYMAASVRSHMMDVAAGKVPFGLKVGPRPKEAGVEEVDNAE